MPGGRDPNSTQAYLLGSITAGYQLVEGLTLKVQYHKRLATAGKVCDRTPRESIGGSERGLDT